MTTIDISAQVAGRRFTESNRARSNMTLNSLAIFCRSRFAEELPNCATANAVRIIITATTINISTADIPLCE